MYFLGFQVKFIITSDLVEVLQHLMALPTYLCIPWEMEIPLHAMLLRQLSMN